MYLFTGQSCLAMVYISVGNRREHGGHRVLVPDQVAEKAVEDGRHRVGKDLPVVHAFLSTKETEN